MGKEYAQRGRLNVSSKLLPLVRESLGRVDPRLCMGYASLLYFAEEVVRTWCMINYVVHVCTRVVNCG